MISVIYNAGASGPSYLSSLIQALGTIGGALIIGIAGGLISSRQNKERDKQDKESQWRSHAIELTKLEAEKQLKVFEVTGSGELRPSIVDFLAYYRDLQKLGKMSVDQLFKEIEQYHTEVVKAGGPPSSPQADGQSGPSYY